MDNPDLKFIKKHYGEHFAKLCRKWFSSILEYPEMLSNIISTTFDEVPTLFDDVINQEEEFVSYILDIAYAKINEEKGIENKQEASPEEIFDKAGYILYPECQTEEDIQCFRKYYQEDEELCTFYTQRLHTCRVWFAVKKDVDKIKRENFEYPQRQDEYGTSVISIQFSKGNRNVLSIKNRYNHTVDNPDATFSNNLDNIAPGLTNAFIKRFNIENYTHRTSGTSFGLVGYIQGSDGKFYKKLPKNNWGNYILCENNIILNGDRHVPHKLNKSKYLVVDNYLFSLGKEKFIGEFVYGFLKKEKNVFSYLGKIKNIKVNFDNEKNRIITVIPEIGENVTIVVSQSSTIIKYFDNNIKEAGNFFLGTSMNLKEISVPNIEKIGDDFLFYNYDVKELYLPKVKTIGNGFVSSNSELFDLYIPNIERIGNYCLTNVNKIEELDLPKLESIGNSFMKYSKLKSINFPKLEHVGENFLLYDFCLEKANMPNLKHAGIYFLSEMSASTELIVPNLSNIFFEYDKDYKRIKNLQELNNASRNTKLSTFGK